MSKEGIMIVRIFSLFFVFIIILTNLLSCETQPKSSNIEKENDTEISSTPPSGDYKAYHFYEYDELAKWITKDENGCSPATEDISKFSDRYVDFINNVIERKIKLLEPCVDDKSWRLEKEMVIMTTEWLDLPSIWYYYNTENKDNDTIVLIYYLNEDEREFLKKNNIIDFINAYAPNYTKPGEIRLSSGIISVKEIVLQLKNRFVTAITRKSSDHRHQTMFVYDDVIISVESFKDFDDASWESFWNSFSLEPSQIYSLTP